MVAARTRAAEQEKQVAALERSAVRGDYAGAKQSRSDERKRAKAIADAEARVHALEAELARIEAELDRASQRQSLDAIQQLGQAHVDVQAALDAAMEAWMGLTEG
jgi:hypothetical protein